jgi:2-oxoisovalerate dehydrogenase E1 component
MKAAYHDPNPVVMLEHKGLYWSKVAGTDDAKCIEPDADYILPFGKGNVVVAASQDAMDAGISCAVITYGMGVYWAKTAEQSLKGQLEIIDLRTLYPLDEELVMNTVKKHGKVLVLTEEPLLNSFAESLAGRIGSVCFRYLDAPVATLGSLPVSAIPLNQSLEKAVLPNADKVLAAIKTLLAY